MEISNAPKTNVRFRPKMVSRTPSGAAAKRAIADPGERVPPKKGGKSWFGKTVAWIHLWPSLISAVILIFVCLTGTIIVYGDEIMAWSAGEARYVSEVKSEKLPLEALIKRVQNAFPERNPPGYLVTYKDPARSVRFNVFDEKDGLRMVYADPYTGEILKDDGTIHFFYTTAHLHNSLLLGTPGLWIVDIATIIFLIELITGLILWWPAKWTRATRDASFKVKWKARWKRLNYDLHNVLGFYALSIAAVLTVSGLIIAFHPLAELTVTAFGGEASHDWQEQLPAFQPGQKPVEMHAAIDRLFEMYPDKKEAQVFTYKLDSAGSYMMRVARTIGLKSADSDEMAVFNRFTGELINIPRGAELHEDIENAYWSLHMGTWMGPVGKFATFTGGLICTSLPVTGFYIWWGRRKKGGKKNRKVPAN